MPEQEDPFAAAFSKKSQSSGSVKPESSGGDPFAAAFAKRDAKPKKRDGVMGAVDHFMGRSTFDAAATEIGKNVTTLAGGVLDLAPEGSTISKWGKSLKSAAKDPKYFPEPETAAEKSGKEGADLMEYMIPVGGEEKLAATVGGKVASGILMAARTLKGAATGYGQSGTKTGAAMGAAPEVVIPAAIKGSQHLIRKFLNTAIAKQGVNALGPEAIKIAEQMGIPLTQAAKTDNPTAKFLEKVAAKGAPDKVEALNATAQKALNEGARKIAGGKLIDTRTAGEAVDRALAKAATDKHAAAAAEHAEFLGEKPPKKRGSKPNTGPAKPKVGSIPAKPKVGSIPADQPEGPKTVSIRAAGGKINESLRSGMAERTKAATAAYKDFRGEGEMEAADSPSPETGVLDPKKETTERVKVGTQKSELIDPSTGKPYETDVIEERKKMRLPMDWKPFIEGFQPTYDNLIQEIPSVQRDLDPGFKVLDEAMRAGDENGRISAVKADKIRGKLLQVGRKTLIPELRSASAGLASTGVGLMDPLIDKAAEEGGVLESLREGRRLTAQKYDLEDTHRGLGLRGKPGSEKLNTAVTRLLAPEDANVNLLRKVAKEDPGLRDHLQAAYIGKVTKLAKQKGGLLDHEKVISEWNKLGDETKQELFGSLRSPFKDPLTGRVIEDADKNVYLPLNIRPMIDKVYPKFEKIAQQIKAVQGESDPGFKVIKQVIESGGAKGVVGLDQAEDMYRSLDKIASQSKSGLLPSPSESLAREAAEELKKIVDIGAKDGKVSVALGNSRRLHGEARQIEDIRAELGFKGQPGTESPNKAIEKLFAPDDANVHLLEQTLKTSPELRPQLISAHIRDITSKARESGGVLDPEKVTHTWNEYGERSKAALYGKEHADKVTEFLNIARNVSNGPKNEKDGIVPLMLKLGLAVTHPGLLLGLAFTRKMAGVMFDPAGADALLELAKTQGRGPLGQAAMATLQTWITPNQKSEDKPPEETPAQP
jgi:hypothetical protein